MDYDNLVIGGPYEGDLVFLRKALSAEFNGITRYERGLAGAQTEKVKAFLKRFLAEEKMHAAAIQKLIMELDKEQKQSFDDEKYCSGTFEDQCVI